MSNDERLTLLLRDKPEVNLNEHFNYWLGVLRERVDPDFAALARSMEDNMAILLFIFIIGYMIYCVGRW